MFTTQHQLTDHGIAATLFPCARTKIAVAAVTRSISATQPTLVCSAVGCHITNGVNAARTTKVLCCDIRPNDGGNQHVAILGNTQLAIVGIQVVLDSKIACAQILQHICEQRGIGCHSITGSYIQLIPCTIVIAKNNTGQEVLDCFAATCFVTNNTGIGGCLAAGIVVVEPEVCKTSPGKGATIVL